MLISPPFLPPRNATESENDWIDRCMSGGLPGEGAFPLGFNLGWHGGMHLTAPMNGTQSERVRAIADGTVVFTRPATEQPAGALPPDHAQAYDGGWTDNGVVVLRHETEIGDGANAQVVFFSIYMHLGAVHSAVALGRTMYRKSELGTAGQIKGAMERKIHFEIVCDDANLARLVGRTSGDLATTADGRLDAVYGQMYFTLPGGTPFYGQKPLDHLPAAHIQPPKPSANAPLPPVQALQPAFTSGADGALIVALHYAGGEGADGHRGSAYLSTLQPDGTSVGTELEEPDGEYNLYTRANEISKAYPAAGRPAPSAVYELLRFGRVVNTANETLTPSTLPHWRQVRYPGGQGWVNLNATGVHKFSDADFPHWQQWRLIDDSADQDSRCDSPTVRSWLDTNGDGQVVPSEAGASLASATVIPKLARAICKFPTEWDAATIDQRWGWLKTSTVENPEPLTDASFELLRAHIQALAFFPSGTGLPASHWHWQPREFVRAFRGCGWLSRDELTQLIPRAGLRNFAPDWNAAGRRINTAGHLNLNRVFRKYGFMNGQRQTAFLSQVYIETGCLQFLNEVGRAHQQTRTNGTKYWPAAMMEYYGGFFGRGLMQLTWASTYADYGKFRLIPNGTSTYIDDRITATSTHDWAAPKEVNHVLVRDQRQWAPRFDPDLVSSNLYNASDSGAFFWVQKHFTGTSNIHRVADEGIDTMHIGRMSILVNGGGNGYNERLQYAEFIGRYRGDGTETAQTSTITATRQGMSNGHWTTGAAITLSVNYTPQRPT